MQPKIENVKSESEKLFNTYKEQYDSNVSRGGKDLADHNLQKVIQDIEAFSENPGMDESLQKILGMHSSETLKEVATRLGSLLKS